MFPPHAAALVDRKQRQAIAAEGHHRRRVGEDPPRDSDSAHVRPARAPGPVDVVAIENVAPRPAPGDAQPIAFPADRRGVARDASAEIDPAAVPRVPVPPSVPEVVVEPAREEVQAISTPADRDGTSLKCAAEVVPRAPSGADLVFVVEMSFRLDRHGRETVRSPLHAGGRVEGKAGTVIVPACAPIRAVETL